MPLATTEVNDHSQCDNGIVTLTDIVKCKCDKTLGVFFNIQCFTLILCWLSTCPRRICNFNNLVLLSPSPIWNILIIDISNLSGILLTYTNNLYVLQIKDLDALTPPTM